MSEPPRAAPRVMAAVVTYNRRDVLRQCLTALITQTRPPDEVVVVDNASVDGTETMVTQEFPSVRLVRMPENTGAAGGFAECLRQGSLGGYDWVWAFNDDDIPEPHALGTMLEAVPQLPPRTGIVACERHNAEGQQYSIGLLWQHRHKPVFSAGTGAMSVPVDIVTFSCTLVSSALVAEVGVPRSDFFMMAEDLEYCLRARRAGWGVQVLRQDLVSALAMGSTGVPPPWRGYYQTRNQLAMTLSRQSVPELWWWAVRTVKFCVGAIVVRDRMAERIRLRMLGTWHALRGVSGRTILPG